jgi:hypothetical protein
MWEADALSVNRRKLRYIRSVDHFRERLYIESDCLHFCLVSCQRLPAV